MGSMMLSTHARACVPSHQRSRFTASASARFQLVALVLLVPKVDKVPSVLVESSVKSEKTVRTVLLVGKVHKEVLVKMVLLVLSDLKVNLVSGDDLVPMANVDKKVNRETKVSKDHPAHLATLETMAHL